MLTHSFFVGKSQFDDFISAVSNNDINLAIKLIEADPRTVSALNDQGKPALHIAAECGYFSMVKLLIDRGCSALMEMPRLGIRASMITNDPEIKKYLLNKEHEAKLGLKITPKVKELFTRLDKTKPLDDFFREKNIPPDYAKELFHLYAQQDSFLNAIIENDLSKVKESIKQIDINKPIAFIDYCTPIFVAISYNRKEIVELFLEASANLNHENLQGIFVFQHAAMWSNDTSMLALFLNEKLKSKVNINKTNRYGNTALHGAIYFRNYDAASYLIENNADVSIKNQFGETPLSCAIDLRCAPILEQLFDKCRDDALINYLTFEPYIYKEKGKPSKLVMQTKENDHLLANIAIRSNNLSLLEKICTRFPKNINDDRLMFFALFYNRSNIICWLLNKQNNTNYTFREVYLGNGKFNIEICEQIDEAPTLIPKNTALSSKQKKNAKKKKKRKEKLAQLEQSAISNSDVTKESVINEDINLKTEQPAIVKDDTVVKDSKAEIIDTEDTKEDKLSRELSKFENKLLKKERATKRNQAKYRVVKEYQISKDLYQWADIRNIVTDNENFSLREVEGASKYLFIPKNYLEDLGDSAEELMHLYKVRPVYCGKIGEQGLKKLTLDKPIKITLVLGKKTYENIEVTYEIKKVGTTARLFCVELPPDNPTSATPTLFFAVYFDPKGFHDGHIPPIDNKRIEINGEYLPIESEPAVDASASTTLTFAKN